MVLAACFTVLSWSLCLSIFNNPEQARNYKMLDILGRLPIHEAYTSQTAPKLGATTALQLRSQFLEIEQKEINTINRSLLRSYLKNFQDPVFSTYVKGTYKVISTRTLNHNDFITDGFAVKLRAYIQIDEYSKPSPYPIILELIFPTPYSKSHTGYHKGDTLEVNILPYFASMLHVSTIKKDDDDDITIITAISLANQLKPPHQGPFDLKPPKSVNIEAPFPLFKDNNP